MTKGHTYPSKVIRQGHGDRITLPILPTAGRHEIVREDKTLTISIPNYLSIYNDQCLYSVVLVGVLEEAWSGDDKLAPSDMKL